MSFDLFFPKPQISSAAFISYFEHRPHYKISEKQAFYENPDTRVYFSFDHHETTREDSDSASVTININYFRPHYFILEIEPEVSAFIRHFDCTISDPQMGGMGHGPYSPEGLLKSWNHGNEFGYSAILKGPSRPNKIWSLPTDRLEAIWRWNYTMAARQEAQTVDRYVPKVLIANINEKVATMAVWPDAISELVPETDYLMIGRGPQNELIIVPFSNVRDLLSPYYTNQHPLSAYELPAPATPRQMHDFVKNLRPTGITAKGIRPDQVLNAELIQKCTL